MVEIGSLAHDTRKFPAAMEVELAALAALLEGEPVDAGSAEGLPVEQPPALGQQVCPERGRVAMDLRQQGRHHGIRLDAVDGKDPCGQGRCRLAPHEQLAVRAERYLDRKQAAAARQPGPGIRAPVGIADKKMRIGQQRVECGQPLPRFVTGERRRQLLPQPVEGSVHFAEVGREAGVGMHMRDRVPDESDVLAELGGRDVHCRFVRRCQRRI